MIRILKFIYGIVCICCISATGANSNTLSVIKKDTAHCLLIGGSFPSLTGKIKNIQVFLYLENDIVDSTNIDSSKDFSYPLEQNKHYCLKIIAGGYIIRYITIDTSLPYGVKSNPMFVFEFTMELKKEMKGVDDYYLDFPIAHINYNAKSDKFDYSHRYTAFMQGKVKKTENEFRLKKSHH